MKFTNVNPFCRDCSEKNIMMDASSLFPKGFHPVRLEYSPDARGSVHQLSRAKAHVKYYFVDFGISVHCPTDSPKLVVGGYGRDQDVPELSFDVPYDPFKLDIFILGNMFRRQICNVSHSCILRYFSLMMHASELLEYGFSTTSHQCYDPRRS